MTSGSCPWTAATRLTRFFESDAGEADPTFSPNGRWVAYDSDESGRWEIYVRPFPGPGRQMADLNRWR